MIRFTAIALALGTTLFSCNAFADHHETSTKAEFRELGDLLAGRWVGDIKYVADWPGQELKRGDKVVGYLNFEWILDKNALAQNGIDGNAASRDLWVWDPATKKIKITNASTNGYVLEALIWKESNNVYAWRLTGGGVADGRAHGGSGRWIFTDGGKKMTIEGQTTLGDVKNDPLKDVYTRLSP